MIFADVNVAAQAALQEAALCSRNVRECGGVIIERDGKFFYTPPHAGKAFGVDVGAYDAPLPEGERIVADYHVHICSPHNRLFSPYFSRADVLVNQGLHTVGYMMSLCDGNVHRFDPSQDIADDEEVDFHSGRVIYLTVGHISGWVRI